MQRFEYKVVPAPKKGEKAKGAKTTQEKFAAALTSLMNALGTEGWEYLRADTLPCDERVGLTGSATHFQNMLVFRRVILERSVAPVLRPALEPDPMPEPASAPIMAPSIEPAMSGSAPPVGPSIAPVMVAPPVGPARSLE
ncbi:MAG: DUF4177 domain-containing protein [Paracoccaceae bacterium]|nr:DUF4177 domain-containing protein [Paracoccaceae bacterium]